MKVFVLGGSGFIGTAVVRELLAHGHAVTALARSERSAESLANAGCEVLRGDIRAARCSAWRLLRPEATASSVSPSSEATVKVLLWSGPSSVRMR